MKVKTCPVCTGTGKSGPVFVEYTDRPGEMRIVNCFTCKGRKVVPASFDPKKGRILRDDRIKRGLSLRQEAKRLGISAAELSKMERDDAWPAAKNPLAYTV
jgi:hypothetical protein